MYINSERTQMKTKWSVKTNFKKHRNKTDKTKHFNFPLSGNIRPFKATF